MPLTLEDDPLRWRACGRAVVEAATRPGEYTAIITVARNLGLDCAGIIARGDECNAATLAERLQRELDALGAPGRFFVAEVRITGRE